MNPLEEELRHQLAFNDVITRILSRFAGCRLNEIDGHIRASLEDIGRHANVDMAYLVLISADSTTWGAAYYWGEPGAEERAARYRKVPFGRHPYMEGQILRGVPVQLSRLEDLPPEAALERADFTQEGVKSLLNVPFHGRGGLVRGALGLRSWRREVAWRPDDIRRMLMLSDCFANVLERKHAEEALQETQRQLRISQKHEALGRLAGGIAHDFNNILGSIIGYADLSRVYLQKTDPVYEFQNKIALAGNQAKELVRQILLVARQQEREKVPIAAHLLVNDVIQLIRNATPKTIDVQAEVESKSPLVLVDPTQIHQVLLNLCTNANHAMREAGGTLRISVNDLLLDDRAIGPFSEVQPGHYVRIEVADTGHGMDSGTLEKIFDPYFTTKAPGEGTGLGLSVVKGIVESHGGVITVKSEPGKGSTFSVYLPRIPVPTVPVDVAVEDHLRGVERILLVEDEPMLLEVAKAILEYLGYTVTSSSQSPEALKLFHARKDEFDLVISDQTMPHITGINLAKAILSIRPDMPIILCSGYSEDIDKTSIAQAGISTFLLKPLSIANLGEAVRSVLDRRDGGRASTDPDGASADAGGD